MAAARGGAMGGKTGKRSNNGRGRRQSRAARRGSGSDDTSDEDYRLGADGEDEVSASEEELEVSDEEESGEPEEDDEEDTSSEESGFEDEDEDFVINPVRRRKSRAKAQPVNNKKKKAAAKKKKRARPPTKKGRSGGARAREEEEDEEPKPARRVRKRRRFGSEDEDEEGEDFDDDVDFSPEDEEEEDEFDEEELEDEGEDEEEDLEDDDDDEDDEDDEEEDDETNDEEDEAFEANNGSRKGKPKRRNKRKSNARRAKSGAKRKKRSKAKLASRLRRRGVVSSDDDEDDEDFVPDDELIEEDESGRDRRADRSTGGNNASYRRRGVHFVSDDSHSSGPDDLLEKEVGRMVGLVQRPRTGGVGRSKQEQKGKGKEEEADQDPPEKRICGVCLSEERKGHVVGILSSCSHFFCFTCILEWSKVESKCPVCKQRFSTITKASGSDVAIQLRPIVVNVPKRDQVYQPSEEEVRGYLDPYANVVCIECQQSGEDTLMLLCDLCNSAAHTYCVGLGREVPEGDWYCDACRLADYEPPNVQNQESQNQQVTNGPEVQRSQNNSNRTTRLEIDMNMPYIPSPERPNNVADESFLMTTNPGLSPLIYPHENARRGAAPRSVRQPAATVSERRALHQRIHSMFNNNWLRAVPAVPTDQASSLNPSQIRHPEGDERQQPPVLFNDLDPFPRYFF